MKLHKAGAWEARPTLDRIGTSWVFSLTSADSTLDMWVIDGEEAAFRLHREGVMYVAVPDDEYEAVMEEPNTASFSELGVTEVAASLVRAWDAITDNVALV